MARREACNRQIPHKKSPLPHKKSMQTMLDITKRSFEYIFRLFSCQLSSQNFCERLRKAGVSSHVKELLVVDIFEYLLLFFLRIVLRSDACRHERSLFHNFFSFVLFNKFFVFLLHSIFASAQIETAFRY